MSGTSDMRKRVSGLAAIALRDALQGDMRSAMVTAEQISEQAGGKGVEYALRAWCDAVIIPYQRATGVADGTPIRPVWADGESGTISASADDVSPEKRWAGRMISARAALDADLWTALIKSLPPDGWAIGDYVAELLGMVAATLQALKAGEPR